MTAHPALRAYSQALTRRCADCGGWEAMYMGSRQVVLENHWPLTLEQVQEAAAAIRQCFSSVAIYYREKHGEWLMVVNG